jgi:hypothetical protein
MWFRVDGRSLVRQREPWEKGAYREEIWRLEFSSKLTVKRTVSTDVQDVRTPKHSTEFNLQKMNLIGI